MSVVRFVLLMRVNTYTHSHNLIGSDDNLSDKTIIDEKKRVGGGTEP